MRIKHPEIQTQNNTYRSSALELALASGENLDEASLLELMLARHFSEVDAQRVARNLLARFKRLTNVLHSDLQTLLSVDGLTLGAATAILQLRQLTKAVCRAEVRNCALLDSQAKIQEYCKNLLGRAEQEEFHALFLNKRGELLNEECLQRGTIDHVSVYPRELLKLAIRYNASFIILAHNHPSGTASPSPADIKMTREISRLLNAIGARVFDHIIVSGNAAFSFRQESLSSAVGASACAEMLCD